MWPTDFFHKGAKVFQWRQDSLSTNAAGKNGHAYAKNWKKNQRKNQLKADPRWKSQT